MLPVATISLALLTTKDLPHVAVGRAVRGGLVVALALADRRLSRAASTRGRTSRPPPGSSC
jgi:hypothetical protein